MYELKNLNLTDKEFAAEVLLRLPYTPNDQQVQVVAALARFCANARSDVAFILNGYAGTGKTSLTGALVKALESIGIKAVLMAPTGRAAKVFSVNSGGHAAYTIHRKIYRHQLPGAAPAGFDAEFGPTVQENNHRDTVFIVDEASMIGGGDNSSLLEDLVTYVYTGDNCRLILLGDTAQLPPVGSRRSPAMKADVLRGYGLKVTSATLTETARQAADSGILFNATRLRRAMLRLANPADEAKAKPEDLIPKLRAEGFDDVRIVSGEELPELLEEAYSENNGGETDTIMITRSNRRAAEYNAAIRSQILYREELLSQSDILIVAKNHYFTGPCPKGLDFIANGDVVRIEKVYGTERRYGLEFADVRVSTTSAGTDDSGTESVSFDAKIILDSLTGEAPALTQQQSDTLYYGVLSDPDFFRSDATVEERLRGLRHNPYWNALQVKFAYAVTCHKAQGGQWRNVFVDLGYVPDEALGLEFYRWLYTAVTRSRSRLYLIAPPAAMVEC